MGIAGGMELVAGALQIAAHCVLRQAENDSAFPGRLALGDPLQTFQFTRRKTCSLARMSLDAKHTIVDVRRKNLEVTHLEKFRARPVAGGKI